jgi:hypothetical protein
LIRRDPVDKQEIVVAAFTGNSNSDRGPSRDIIENMKQQDPDLLFFSGDQVHDHHEPFAAWLLFGRQFGEITRDRQTVAIPDDHDVGSGTSGSVWDSFRATRSPPSPTSGSTSSGWLRLLSVSLPLPLPLTSAIWSSSQPFCCPSIAPFADRVVAESEDRHRLWFCAFFPFDIE